MKLKSASVAFIVSVFAITGTAMAGKDTAKDLATKAEAAIASNGFDNVCPLIRANAEGSWRQSDSHIWILDLGNVIVCDGMDVSFEGFDLDDLDDPTGVNIGGVIAELPEGGSFAQWQWANPDTNIVGTQTNFVIKTPNYIIGAGSFE